jgi:hypothetical protein
MATQSEMDEVLTGCCVCGTVCFSWMPTIKIKLVDGWTKFVTPDTTS